MTNDQLTSLAKQAGILAWWDSGNENFSEFFMLLQRFAELVRNQTLEEAAKVCDERWAACPLVLADAIRSMKK